MAFVYWKPNDSDKNDMANTTSLCRLEAVCSDYPGLRDVCATAGNFEKCMEIKYGSREEYDIAKQFCTNDGKAMIDPAKVPGFFDCWAAKLKGG